MRLLPILLMCLIPSIVRGALPNGPPDESQVAVALAHTALRLVPSGQHHYTRFLYVGHIREADKKNPKNDIPDGPGRRRLWGLVSGDNNGKSHKRKIYCPPVILEKEGKLYERDALSLKPEEWSQVLLFRLDTSAFGWDPKVWEMLAEVEPHFRFIRPDLRGKLSTVRIKTDKEGKPLDFKVDPVNPKEGGSGGRTDDLIYTLRAGSGLTQVRRGELRQGEVEYRKGADNTWRSVGTSSHSSTEPKAAPEISDSKKRLRAIWTDAQQELELQKACQTEVPILYADYYYWQTSIQRDRAPGPGYYDFLEIKNEKDYQLRVGFDGELFKKQFSEFAREYREAVNKSGVSRQPRRIGAFDKLKGKLLITYDNEVAVGPRNPLDTPDDRFQFAATRQLANGANGLLVMGLFDKDGTRQESAPDFVGPDRTSTDNDGRIHIGQCLRCHDQGVKTFKGYFKRIYRDRIEVTGPDGKAIYKFGDEYFQNIEAQIEESRLIHERALKEATGWSSKEYAQAITEEWQRYHSSGVSSRRAARDLGVTQELLRASIKRLKAKEDGKPEPLQGIRVYDEWLGDDIKDEEPLDTFQYHEVVGELHLIMMAARGVQQPPKKEKP